MVTVHAPAEEMTFGGPGQDLAGLTVSLYSEKRVNWLALTAFLALFLGALAVLVYSFFSTIDLLWVYGTAATGITGLLLAAVATAAIFFNYVRTPLFAKWGDYLSFRNCLLVVKGRDGKIKAWYCWAMTATRVAEDRIELFVTPDFSAVTKNALKENGQARQNRRLARSIKLRAMVQTDGLDLQEYVVAHSAAVLAKLARVARIGGRLEQ